MEYATEADIEALMRAFETCALPCAQWTHAAHLTGVLSLLLHNSYEDAVNRMHQGIQTDNQSQGIESNQPEATLIVSDYLDRGRRCWRLLGTDLLRLISKATYGLAVMLSSDQSRVGQLHSEFAIRDFPQDIQSFSDTVQ